MALTSATPVQNRHPRWSAAWQILRAAALAYPVAAAASVSWIALLVANARFGPAIPWALPVMALFLGFYCWYLSGRGWPKRTAAARSQLLRARLVSWQVFAWAGVAGGLGLISLAGLWIVLVRLTGVGGNPLESPLLGYPLYILLPGIAIASLVSPLSEEAAFRGYAQSSLEKTFTPMNAIVISSAFFALWHGPTQGFFWSKLAFFFIVGALFGTIAYLTQSTLPALPVHIAGDILFFAVIWPQDAFRTLVLTHGVDLSFLLNLAQVVVFGALSLWALKRLGGLRRQPDGAGSSSHAGPRPPSHRS